MTDTASDRRQFPRAQVSYDVDVRVEDSGRHTRTGGRLVVLGAGGAFLELDDRYPLSTPLHLRFESDTLGTIGCRAIVRRVIEGKGVTVEFLDIEPGDRERITTFVEKHRATAQPRQ